MVVVVNGCIINWKCLTISSSHGAIILSMDTRMLSDRGKMFNTLSNLTASFCALSASSIILRFASCCSFIYSHQQKAQCNVQTSCQSTKLTTKCAKKSRSTLRSYGVSNFRSRNILQIQYKAQCRWEYKNYKQLILFKEFEGKMQTNQHM